MVTETTRVTTINFPRNINGRRLRNVSNKRVEFDNVSDRRFFLIERENVMSSL